MLSLEELVFGGTGYGPRLPIDDLERQITLADVAFDRLKMCIPNSGSVPTTAETC